MAEQRRIYRSVLQLHRDAQLFLSRIAVLASREGTQRGTHSSLLDERCLDESPYAKQTRTGQQQTRVHDQCLFHDESPSSTRTFSVRGIADRFPESEIRSQP